MEPIKSFRITDMTLCGFKSFSRETHFTFGDPTVITGGNGRGKSSLADAIAFAVTGLPFFGERKIDRMHSDDNPELYIRMSFLDEHQMHHELIRTRQKNRMTIHYDGYEIRQTDLNDMFGERDVFLSILNPLYFIEELGDDGKQLLARYLPLIPQEAVLEQMSESSREQLKDLELLSPEGHLKRLRESIREQEKTLTYLQGQLDMADSQEREKSRTLSDLSERLTALRTQQQELEELRFCGMDVPALQEELANLSARYSELAGDARGGPTVDERLLSLNQKLGECRASAYVPKYALAIAQSQSNIRDLAAQYKKESAQCAQVVPGFSCPTCHRAVAEPDIPQVKQAIQASIAQITAKGREQRAQLDELTALEKQAAEDFEQGKAENIAKLEREIAQLNGDIADPDRAASADQAGEIHARIQQLTSDLEFGLLSPEEYERWKNCAEEAESLQAKMDVLRNTDLPSAQELERRIQTIKDSMVEQESLAKCLVFYISKRAEMTFSTLKMNRVAISLYDILKSTGEVKDVFKFTYNGRRYDRLSLSEKIRAGLEVSELFKRLTSRCYPTFIDNMESVDDLNNVRPTGQLIMAKCIANTALEVRPVRPIHAPVQQAA